jgi:hypothetical protein
VTDVKASCLPKQFLLLSGVDNRRNGPGNVATVNDSAPPTDLQMDSFRLSLTYGWHKIVEGQKRLQCAE